MDGADFSTLDRVAYRRSLPGHGQLLDLPIRVHILAVELSEVRSQSLCGQRLVSLDVCCCLRPVLAAYVPKPGHRWRCVITGWPVMSWCSGYVCLVAVRRLSPFEEHVRPELESEIQHADAEKIMAFENYEKLAALHVVSLTVFRPMQK